jgi:hypothetical protein
MVLLLDGILVSWSLALGERDGHDDLCGSDRLNIISYVHGRTKLYYAQAYLTRAFLFLTYFSIPVKRRLPDHFITQGRVVTMRPGARQVAPKWLKPYTTSMSLIARSS